MKVFRFYSAAIITAALLSSSSCNKDEQKKPALDANLAELVFSNAQENKEVEITADGEWTASAFSSWCTVEPEAGKGNATLTVSVSENATGEDRNTTVEIIAKNASKVVSKEIAVNQLAYIPFISINNPDRTVPSGASVVEVVVKTNLPTFYLIIPMIAGWDYPKDSKTGKEIKSWTKPAGAGIEWEQTVSITLATNQRSVAMEGDILFGNSNQSIKATLSLKQSGLEYLFFEVSGGQQQKEVTGSWTASSNADWCTVPASGSGNITVNAGENTGVTVGSTVMPLPRRAIVTITSDNATRQIIVAQEPKLTPNRSHSWTDASGTRHESIPADKKFWNTGDVLEYRTHTKGNGIKVVFFNDAFNKMEMAVGGVYETVTGELAELMLDMPVMRDYADYFDVCILMTVWPKSGLYNQFPKGGYHNPHDGRAAEFRSRIDAMPQLQGMQINGKVTGFYIGNGLTGGFMSEISGMNYACYSYNAEGDPCGWTIHEFMGHAFANLGDQYDGHSSTNISDWDFYLKNIMPVNLASDDPLGEFGPHNYVNNRIVEWNQEAWDQFIALPGNSQYASNLNDYRQSLPADYRQKHPTYTGGDYIWKNARNDNDFMVNHPLLKSVGYDRWLVYRRIKRLAGEQYGLLDFFANDQQYANVTGSWHDFLGLAGWWYSVNYDPHATTVGSPFMPWDVN